LGAAFHALSGPRHGGASAQVEALVRELSKPERADQVVSERLLRGELVPGFGHTLYPQGDPRAVAMLAWAAEATAGGRRVNHDYECIRALCAAMARAGLAGPNLDAGLVALCSALDLPKGAAAAVFAIGRIGGWVAHALEQRRQPYILRPRARYVAPALAHPEPEPLRSAETAGLRRGV
jgi:citrate synthase